ncbi:MAG: redoxin domain-containing protein [Planctomicrobium sp.]|nr:redoxin domain-containing protein [Planctomicrobium sp.]
MSRIFKILSLTCFSLTTYFVNSLAADRSLYRGTLEQVARDGSGTPVKEFQVRCFNDANSTAKIFYVLEESNNSLPWVEQFGETDRKKKILANSGIVIGYRHLDRNYVIPVGLPFFADHKELQEDYEWNSADGEFVVSGEKVVNGHPCWEVKATIGIARHHVFYVRKSDPIIEAATQTVFMGPGDRFRLKFERDDTEAKAESPEKINQTIQLLTQLKSDLKRDEDKRFEPVQPKQIKSIASSLPTLIKTSQETELKGFVKEINTAVQLSLSRNSRVEDLAGSMLQQEIPKFTLQKLNAEEISSSSFAGKTVILHFWDYANPTLEQPYGQVGYLDFINSRWSDKGVLVYGVAVNSQLTDPETKAKAIREIQKLKQFMKLGYELTIDSGSVLNGFGNPTRLGEELPLWVVISPEGKIAHYKTGFYEVDNRVGLREIHDLLEQFVN